LTAERPAVKREAAGPVEDKPAEDRPAVALPVVHRGVVARDREALG